MLRANSIRCRNSLRSSLRLAHPGTAGLDAAKIATIALHTARLIYSRQGSLMRCFNPLIGCGKSLLDSPGFPLPRPGKILQAFVKNRKIR